MQCRLVSALWPRKTKVPAGYGEIKNTQSRGSIRVPTCQDVGGKEDGGTFPNCCMLRINVRAATLPLK